MDESEGILSMEAPGEFEGFGLPGPFAPPCATEMFGDGTHDGRCFDEVRCDTELRGVGFDGGTGCGCGDEFDLEVASGLFGPAPAEPMFAGALGIAGVGEHENAGFHGSGDCRLETED